ncbi:MAG: hypothetical protein B6I28_06050 [Fusobacteriia bacterium 4572_132]|nr:MAG: hypothetical protein B6I28_06050 [Fusobacteriia bacterium 4572_132]
MFGILNLIIRTIEALIFLRIIISWIMPQNRGNEFVEFINGITEPILAPFRVILPLGRMGGLDLSPIVVLFLLDILKNVLFRIF